MAKKLNKIVLPALRGVMGDWVYYSCLMDLGELSSRVDYAEEIHNNKAFSDMIQRQIKNARSTQIADYLKEQPDRFFNSLVVATYEGQPNWHALSDVRNSARIDELKNLSEEIISSVGFLTFRGDEKLFALDGQHRLAGIKKAVKNGLDGDPYDEVSVIFVAHRNTKEGIVRTRRLFTTLNKTAKPVSKNDIIALDEDDVMAICVRRLIEETDLFSGNRIAFVAKNNMPTNNIESLTTIGNLYDVLKILFTTVNLDPKNQKISLPRVRPDDQILDKYFDLAKTYFLHLQKNFKEIDEFFNARDTKSVIKKYRGSHGGNVLFRPIGLEIMTLVISRLAESVGITEAVKAAAKLPSNLNEAPYEHLMWDSARKVMLNSHKITVREVLLYMVGKQSRGYPEPILLERYRKEIGDSAINLPAKVE